MNLAGERTEYDAAGALAEELPWWGYLKDDRICLTRMASCYASAASPPARWMAEPPKRSMRCWNAGPVCSPMSSPAAGSISICSGGRLFFPTRNPITAIACRQSRAGGARHSLPNDCRTSRHIWSGVTIRGYNRPPPPMAEGRGGSTPHGPGWPASGRPMRPSTFTTALLHGSGRRWNSPFPKR